METFQQILDLDEDTHEFSKGMAWAYFSQAEQTFKKMDEALWVTELILPSAPPHFTWIFNRQRGEKPRAIIIAWPFPQRVFRCSRTFESASIM
jgi:hypothetical protein